MSPVWPASHHWSLPGNDFWLLPRERSGAFTVTCTAEVLLCGKCGGVCDRTDGNYEKRGRCRKCGYEAVLYHPDAKWGDDMGYDRCGHTWTAGGTSVEGHGVELHGGDECPRCGASGDALEAEPC